MTCKNFLNICSSFFLFFSFVIFSSLYADVALPPQLTLKQDSEVVVEGKPIPLNLVVVHTSDQEVSASVIHFDEPVLSCEKIGEEIVNPNNLYKQDLSQAPVVSRFRITLPPKSSGIYTIGPAHLTVGKYTFDSNTSTINVQAPVISPNFQLTARILQQDGPIYPGQIVTIEYRLLFTTPMKLTKEDLPLLRPNGLMTDGSPEIRQLTEGSNFVQVIVQRAKAVQPGVFDMGVSTVEGLRIVPGSSGSETIYPLYRAIAPSFMVTVSPFPKEGCPDSFYGAVGSFIWRSRILNDDKITLNDTIQVEYRASGRGDLATVSFPPKSSFPDLNDYFMIQKWPETGKVDENTKTFILELRARRAGKNLIPGLAISSFDPSSKQYLTSRIIPLIVTISGSEGDSGVEKRLIDIQRAKNEGIGPIPVTQNMLDVFQWLPEYLISATLFSIVGIVLQLGLRYSLHIRAVAVQKVSAKKLFEKALLEKRQMKESFKLFRKAIISRLIELQLLEKEVDILSQIPEHPELLQEAKITLMKIDDFLYQGRSLDRERRKSLQDEIILLYHKMK